MARSLQAPSLLASEKELSDFLKNVEKRAFKRALYAVRDHEAALDIVQDAMIRLAEKYGDRPAAELPLIFQRILSNATMDWFRRQKVRGAIMKNFSDFESAGEDGDFDILETLETQDGSTATESAAENVSRAQILLAIEGQCVARAISCCAHRRHSAYMPDPAAGHRACDVRNRVRRASLVWDK